MSCGKRSGELLREFEKAEAALKLAKLHARPELITRLAKQRDDAYAAWRKHVAS
jgi:hypothetical protein